MGGNEVPSSNKDYFQFKLYMSHLIVLTPWKNQGSHASLPSKDICVLALLIFTFATIQDILLST